MLGFRVNMVGTPDLLLRSLKRDVREGLARMPRMWHGLFLREHFKPSAQHKYGYRARTSKYLRRKKAKAGHMIPLVYTGLMRRQLTRGIFVRGTERLMRGTMYGPRYVYMRPTARNNRPALGDEATRTTVEERQALTDALGAFLVERMRSSRARRQVVIR